MKLRDVVVACCFFFLGALVTSRIPLQAQNAARIETRDPANESGGWEIAHGAYGQQSFYVIKHNRLTGETLILNGEHGGLGNGWELLPENDKTGKHK